ncbi:hypothetical protein PF008_g27061 [Phytophthora fragariae]|uniref:Uncharacterized protein n=1 Tax=Phytophthora fragariae TaxID=53985 RepID=A0A6G0QFF7_9STRA|nr:hypothetical protein PF008_g27061 [Phytophthora fragariae]
MVKILPGPYNLTRPLLAAALNVALEEGYTNIAAVMIRKSHLHSVECALGWAASRGYTDIVVMILDIYALRRYQFAPALKKAALNGECDMMKLLLEKCPLPIDTPTERKHRVIGAMWAFLAAAINADRVDVAQLIVEKLGPDDYELARAVGESMQTGKEEITKFLLGLFPRVVPAFFATEKSTPQTSGFQQSQSSGGNSSLVL